MKAMILAAGEGTRLRPHTLKLPKPTIPFLGIPLAYYSLGLFENTAELDVVVNTFHLPTQIENTYQQVKKHIRSLNFSHETGRILGSGGGLKNAEVHIGKGESFFMLNADEVILPADPSVLRKAFDFHNQSKNLSTLLVMKHPLVGSKFGGVWTEGKSIKGFGKTSPQPGLEPWHFLGIQILSPEIFDFLPLDQESNILYDAITMALKQGHQAGIFEVDGLWFETGNPQDFLHATQECLKILNSEGKHRTQLLQIQKRFKQEDFILAKTDTALNLVSASSMEVLKNSHLRGYNVIGSNLICHGPVEIQNAVIGNQVTLFSGEKVTDTLIV